MEQLQKTERTILVYGNADTSKLGFPTEDSLIKYIETDIFTEYRNRYRYTQRRKADVIVLSREGWAYGHFDVESKEAPTEQDKLEYPPVKTVYIVSKSTRYNKRVRLFHLSIKVDSFGTKITEEQFKTLLDAAGGTQEFPKVPPFPQSTVEQERILRAVRDRLGQSPFRKSLIAAYNSRCAVTDCDAEEALEAAHIEPYNGIETNHTSNGILLRADIHTLFDKNLIGIDPKTLTVALSPFLKNTTYSELHGKPLKRPSALRDRPDVKALAARWQAFSTKG